jgi:MFS transporter, DHA1 family, multidrug resistance protein
VLSWLGYPAVFGLGALAALTAAVVLLAQPCAPPPPRSDGRMRQVGRRLWPLLSLTAITATAEAGVGLLLLLLHLQRQFLLGPVNIALLLGPGF